MENMTWTELNVVAQQGLMALVLLWLVVGAIGLLFLGVAQGVAEASKRVRRLLGGSPTWEIRIDKLTHRIWG